MSVSKSAAQSGEGKSRKKTGREARARANFLRAWKKSHAKYRLTDDDVEICHKFRKQFKAIPEAQRARLISKAVSEIIEKYRVQHEVDQVDAFMQERIDRAVRKWIRDRTRSRVKAAKIGTKAYNGRRVFYHQNKDEVNKRVAVLLKDGDAKEALGVRAKVTTEMYSGLSKEEQDKLQTIANEWNATGPSEEVQLEAAKKAIPKRSLAFFEDCRKQFGAVFFVLYAHKSQNGVDTGIMDFTNNMAGESRAFSSKMTTELEESGIQELWDTYVNANWGIMEAEQAAGVRRMKKTRKTAPLATNKYGEPILPDVDLIAQSGDVPTEFKGLREYLQAVLRTFITMHWGLAGPVTSKEPTVPWAEVVKDPRDYISEKYLPSDLVDLLKDPSKVPIADCLTLLTFWLKRQRTGKKKAFEFSHWRQSRFKPRVTREPRRRAPEVPVKPGTSVGPDDEESTVETSPVQTRSKKKAKHGGKRGKDQASSGESSAEESPVDSNESTADDSPEGDEESESENESSSDSESGEWADDEEWGGVDGTASETNSMPGNTGNHGDEEDQDDSEDNGLKPPRSSPPSAGNHGDQDDQDDWEDEDRLKPPRSSPPSNTSNHGDDDDQGNQDDPEDRLKTPRSSPPGEDFPMDQANSPDFGFPGSSPPPMDEAQNAGDLEDDDDSDNASDIEAVSEMVTPKKLAQRDSRESRSPGSLKTTPKQGREESHRALGEDSDNPSDVDKVPPVGSIKIGPPSRKPSKRGLEKNALPKRGREHSHRASSEEPDSSDVDKTPTQAGMKYGPPPKKKKRVSQPKPEARPGPAVPEDSPAKNTRGQTKPKPRPVRQARVAGLAIDERFDLSRRTTRSSDSPNKAPGHYARLNAGR